jgi:hypothetical protein
MRKLLWCGVAASLFGGVGLGYLAWRHPESLAGRCLHKANVVAQRGHTAETADRAAEFGDEQAADEAVADEPVPEAEEPAPGEEHHTLGRNVVAAFLHDKGACCEPEHKDAEITSPIVIHEDEEPAGQPEKVIQISDEKCLELMRPLTEEVLNGLPHAEPAAPYMPYCEDAPPSECKPAPYMPYADEEQDKLNLTFWYEIDCQSVQPAGGVVDDTGCWDVPAGCFVVDWCGNVTMAVRAGCEQVTDTVVSGFWGATVAEHCTGLGWWVRMLLPTWGVETPQGGYEQAEPKDETETVPEPPMNDNPYIEDHHNTCPYSGCGAPKATPRCDPAAEEEPKDGVRLEKKPHSFRLFLRSLCPVIDQTPAEGTPRHPDIDTMEFRPSDLPKGMPF